MEAYSDYLPPTRGTPMGKYRADRWTQSRSKSKFTKSKRKALKEQKRRIRKLKARA